jgi:hypothetical protein
VEHQEAIETHAAEDYLLGDLTADEHEAFEEHFADCETCFADVRDGATVVAAVRAEAREKKPAWGGLRNLIPTLAAAASIAVFVPTVIYQHIQLAEAREPHIVPPRSVSDNRAGGETLSGRGPFTLEFEIPPTHPSPQYQFAIVDARGRRIAVPDPVPATQAKQVDLQIPRGLLSPGNYSLVVTGTGGVPVNKIEFTVQ